MNIAKDLFFAQQALSTLFSVTNKLQTQGDKRLQDITIRQLLAIPALIHAPDGKASINHIARSMGTSKQNAKQIVDALERKGYLSVTPSAQDKRALHISITAQGQQAFGLCSERTDEFLATIFRHFSSAELETLCTLLQKLHSFDGTAQFNPSEHSAYNASASADILRHHGRFAALRATAKEAE